MATRYWIGGSGTWSSSSTTNWSANSGGAGGASAPTSSDDVVFDNNSDTGAGFTVTISTSAVCRSLDASALDQVMTIAGTAAWSVHGSLLFHPTNINITYTGALTFRSTTSITINANGVPFLGDVNFNGVGGTFVLQENLSTAANKFLNLINGTLDINGKTFVAGICWVTATSGLRGIAFNGGKIQITGSGTTVWNGLNLTDFSVSGDPVVEFTYNGGTGTRTIRHGETAGTEANAISAFITAGTDTVAILNSAKLKTLDFTGFSGSNADSARTIYGNLVFSSTATFTTTNNTYTLAASSGNQKIKTNGATVVSNIAVNSSGTTVQLDDNLTMSPNVLTLTSGTLNVNGFNYTASAFSSSNANTRTLNFGSGGVMNISGSSTNAWQCGTATNLTVTGSGTINMTSASAKTFSGGGAAYTGATLNQGGAGALTITGANTFANITNTVQPATITFPASTTTTVGIFTASGTPAGQITLNSSTAATQATISTLDSRPVTASYVSIQDIAATGKSDWYADTGRGAVDLGNNTGWQFIPLAVRRVIHGVTRNIIRPIMYPDLV
jgi:hypothetical protein